MPDVGTPRHNTPAETSHVSTSEWQSFEIRMRRRRAERCVRRAEEALAAGNEAVAAAALAEARDLSPLDTPDLATLQMRTVVATPDEGPVDLHQVDVADLALHAPLGEPTAPTGRPGRGRMLAAAVVVIGLAIAGVALSTGIFAPPSAPSASASLQQPGDPPAARTARAPLPPALPPPARPEVQPDTVPPTGDIVPAAAPAAAPSSVASEPAPVRAAYTPPPPRVGTAGDDALPAVVGSTPSVAVAPPDPLPAPPPSIPVAPLESAGAPAAAVARTPPPPPPPAPEPVEPRIRAVLSSYEAAFGSLDAAAVHRLWPGVDERSLARAFDGLTSQAVSLGDCAISVRGDTATARCQGSTTWAPKVGGGSRTAARRWEFALHNAGAGWLIVRADVR
jgi:hypothetical protein